MHLDQGFREPSIRVLVADSSSIHTHLLANALKRDSQLEVMPFDSDSRGLVAAVMALQIDVLVISSDLEDEPSRGFETQQPHVRAHDARGLIDSAVEAVARADGGLGGLQDSMLPIEVGDAQLRAGLEEVRVLLGEVGERARRLERTLGR